LPTTRHVPTQDGPDAHIDTFGESDSRAHEEHRVSNGNLQVIPLILSSNTEDADCYSIYSAQHSLTRRILIKRHPYEIAFAITDFKLQGRTLPKLILSLPKRRALPWMTLQSFYVLISRVPRMSGLRLLQYDRLGIQSVRTQMPDIYLYAWERGFDSTGIWDAKLAAKALQHIRHTRQVDKRALATSTREQSFTDNQRSPCKRPSDVKSSPQKPRQSLYKCGNCNSTSHNTQTCQERPTGTRRNILNEMLASSEGAKTADHASTTSV
jgi:hypothetical protein